jgi:hypothetical protein
MHIYGLAQAYPSSAPLTPFPPFAFSTFRLWDVTPWTNLEPARGVFNWSTLDGTIQAATAHGVTDFIFTFGAVPQWASSNPSGSCPGGAGTCFVPADMRDFDDFATQLMRRYCGVIKYYETWNEPTSNFVGNAQLLTLTQHLYRIVKDPTNCGCSNGTCSPGAGANPNKVLLPSIGSPAQATDRQWLQDWLASVGNPYPYADIAAFHGYSYASNPEDIYQGVQFMRTTLGQYGLGNVELWNTEASWGEANGYTGEWEASWLMRYHIVQAAAGVSRFTWYMYDSCAWGTLWDNSCGAGSSPGLQPAGSAYRVVQQWLVGATVDYCESHADGTWACKLTRPNNYVGWAVWNANTVSHPIAVPAKWALSQYRDWHSQIFPLGAEVLISQMPILLENKSAF